MRGAFRAAGGAPMSLDRLSSVLLVEDDVIIAMDVSAMIAELGAPRVVTAATPDDALRIIDSEAPTAAILDVRLGQTTSERVAHELRGRGVPFVLATGVDEDAELGAFPDAPVLRKPFGAAMLRASLDALS